MTNSIDTKNKPWEDTLILAFRDMQWIKRIQSSTTEDKQELAKPPALMIKLDGKAETAAGDILAGVNSRYFLLEFKSALSGFKTEETKYVYKHLSDAWSSYPPEKELLRLSLRGHLLVYPQPKDNKSLNTFALLHRLDLWCVPYCILIPPHLTPEISENCGMLEYTFYGENCGLDVDEISLYLQLLVDKAQAEGGNDEFPLKTVIASPDGLFWPAGSISAFKDFVQNIEPLANTLRNQKNRAAQASIRDSKPDNSSPFSP